ncbi:MAG TPA: DUF6502 family protein [Gammaproteobacteria bacterium]
MNAPATIDLPRSMRRTLLVFGETVMRPIIRILLRHGLSYPEFNQIARKLFVDIAMQEAEFRIPRKRRQYKSRVALLTGLSRKEVLRLVDAPRPADDADLQSANRAARVLSGWLTDSNFCAENGEPLVLPFRAGTARRSFSTLAAEYSGDIPPRAILDELVRSDSCVAISDDEIRVDRRAYVARHFDVETMASAAMRAASSLSSIDAQLAPQPSSMEKPREFVSMHRAAV